MDHWLFYCYVPESHLEAVKEAVFQAGGGQIGEYEHCAWQVKGQGQFRPSAGANPFIGKAENLEVLEEYRVEIAIASSCVEKVLQAFLQAHPYEEPAYGLMKVQTNS